MAASTSFQAPTNSTSVLFRAWGSAISAALSAAGWVQTADTGQINWTTVTAAVSINTSAGFEVWRTNDSNTTWYLKIEYGAGAATSTPSIWLTIGTATNGSGTLSGQTSTRKQLASNANTTTQYNMIFGGGTAWFSTCCFTQNTVATAYWFWFTIERTKDTAGADADVAMMICGGSGGSNSSFSQTVPKTGTVPTQRTYVPTPLAANSTLVSGTTVGLLPVFPQMQTTYPAALGVMSFFYSDISTDSSTITVSRYGSNRTYMVCKLTNSTNYNALSNVNLSSVGYNEQFAPLIRYE